MAMEALKTFCAAASSSSSSSFLLTLLLILLVASPAAAHIMSVVGDHHESSPAVASHDDLHDLGKFAIDQHNSRQVCVLLIRTGVIS